MTTHPAKPKTDKETAGRDTALRYLATLSAIPMLPSKISVKMIEEKIARDGYKVTPRTIQRDLERLSQQFPLTSEADGKSNLWAFNKNSSSQWPAMDVDAALGILLVENNLREQLPLNVVKNMEPLVGQARATLETLDKGGYKKALANSLRILPRGFVLQKPEVLPEVVNKIMECLVKKRQMLMEWKGKEATVNPLGLVMRGSVLYLVCTFDNSSGAYFTPAVHRIKQANMAGSTVVIPAGFNLDEAIDSKKLSWKLDDGKIHSFEMEVIDWMADVLEETPINDTQQIKHNSDEDDEWVTVTFQSQYTMQLKEWLLGLGDNVVVHKPVKIRNEMKKTAMEMVELYKH